MRLLPARGGVGFPLTPEEMSWQLSCFDIQVSAASGTRPLDRRYGRQSRRAMAGGRGKARLGQAARGAIAAALDFERNGGGAEFFAAAHQRRAAQLLRQKIDRACVSGVVIAWAQAFGAIRHQPRDTGLAGAGFRRSPPAAASAVSLQTA